jgi:hypothetical protein
MLWVVQPNLKILIFLVNGKLVNGDHFRYLGLTNFKTCCLIVIFSLIMESLKNLGVLCLQRKAMLIEKSYRNF